MMSMKHQDVIASSTCRGMPARLRAGAVVVLLQAVAACSTLPGSGPTTDAVLDGATVELGSSAIEPFALVRMNTSTAQSLQAASTDTSWSRAPLIDSEPPAFVIEEGDTVQVSLINVSNEGFLDFTQSAITPISQTLLPPQVVGGDGQLNVPVLGRVTAAGLTPERLERVLTDRLAQVLVDPSLVVQVLDRQTARATVLGEVAEPGSKPILRRSLRLVDLIGLAGGQTAPVDDLVVTFVRGDVKRQLPLSVVLSDPAANVRVHPGDVVSVGLNRKTYVIRGAVGVPGRYTLVEPEFNLEEAIAQARGMANRRASRKGVFVFRLMPKPALVDLGLQPDLFGADTIPTVFQFDYRVPTQIFAARSFHLEDGDVVFITDNWIEELNKIFGIFNTVVPVQSFVPAPEL